MCLYMHTHICVYMYVYIHIYMIANTHQRSIYIYVCACVCMVDSYYSLAIPCLCTSWALKEFLKSGTHQRNEKVDQNEERRSYFRVTLLKFNFIINKRRQVD